MGIDVGSGKSLWKSEDGGLVYVFTGDGKGKTSAAIGTAMRTLLSGGKVVWVSWYKHKKWKVSEMKLVSLFSREQLEMFWLGEGFYTRKKGTVILGRIVKDEKSVDEHRWAAKYALELCRRKLMELNKQKKLALLIMDEVLMAIDEGLVEMEEVLSVVSERGNCNIVLTGRGASKKIVEGSDLVTEMKNVKHPFDKGILARKGLDY